MVLIIEMLLLEFRNYLDPFYFIFLSMKVVILIVHVRSYYDVNSSISLIVNVWNLEVKLVVMDLCCYELYLLFQIMLAV